MIIVDESVSNKKFSKVLDYLKRHNYSIPEIIHIRDSFPGMPDQEIMRHLLYKCTIFITSDRVLHNKILLHKKRSIYIDENEKITEKKLKNINIPERNPHQKKSELLSDYETEKSDIHEKILPELPRQLKKLRTKRRRIRNHFDGINNIGSIDVSLSAKHHKKQLLIGFKIKIISNTGVKSLEGSEAYILEKQHNDENIHVCYVLIFLLQLLLHSKKVSIYYDSKEMSGNFEENNNSQYLILLTKLKSYFPGIHYHPVNKGYNIENIRKKISIVAQNDKGNQIIPGELEKIKDRILNNV